MENPKDRRHKGHGVRLEVKDKAVLRKVKYSSSNSEESVSAL